MPAFWMDSARDQAWQLPLVQSAETGRAVARIVRPLPASQEISAQVTRRIAG
jgi:hypothetical protein